MIFISILFGECIVKNSILVHEFSYFVCNIFLIQNAIARATKMNMPPINSIIWVSVKKRPKEIAKKIAGIVRMNNIVPAQLKPLALGVLLLIL